jgi:hypothetical protein
VAQPQGRKALPLLMKLFMFIDKTYSDFYLCKITWREMDKRGHAARTLGQEFDQVLKKRILDLLEARGFVPRNYGEFIGYACAAVKDVENKEYGLVGRRAWNLYMGASADTNFEELARHLYAEWFMKGQACVDDSFLYMEELPQGKTSHYGLGPRPRLRIGPSCIVSRMPPKTFTRDCENIRTWTYLPLRHSMGGGGSDGGMADYEFSAMFPAAPHEDDFVALFPTVPTSAPMTSATTAAPKRVAVPLLRGGRTRLRPSTVKGSTLQ